MNEGEYLELVNQLKEKFDRNELRLEKIIDSNKSLMKHIMVAYSLARLLDEGEYIELNDYKVFVEILRNYLSNVLEDEVIRDLTEESKSETQNQSNSTNLIPDLRIILNDT